ncbi:MAG: hypothetical protein HZB23_05165 [Deltaproteobacteria bacterium]|nr:hypothetical protein [Deltaproteobacteria bacterium]
MPKFESEILTNLKLLYYRLAGRTPALDTDSLAVSFREKYAHFKMFLESNSELLKIITDIEEKLAGKEIFGLALIRSLSSRAVFHSLRLISSFEALSGKPLPAASALAAFIQREISSLIDTQRAGVPAELTLSHAKITKEMVDLVGGKNANLGEVRSRVGLPVPAGFAITTEAFAAFFDSADLWDEISKVKLGMNPDDTENIQAAGEAIQRLILTAKVPDDVADAILRAHAELAAEIGADPESLNVAMRSSAIGEDSALSYAGQYLTLLNVPASRLMETYKIIVASLYTPRAISYRMLKGVAGENTAMSVAVLCMVPARSSGVMYTRHPFDPADENVVINSVWGLGLSVVDGTANPDVFTVSRDGEGTILSRTITHKGAELVMGQGGGISEKDVPPERAESPSLTDEAIRTLTRYGLALERHYGSPQDVEWAIDRSGRTFILQARPLGFRPEADEARKAPPVEGYGLLVSGGSPAAPGVGSGPAFLVKNDDDLAMFPAGAVLVAPHSSPQFMVVMKKAAAIVTDFGSVAGHMASLAREFSVPTVLAAKNATRVIKPGTMVTVDAYSGRVYEGRVERLLALARPDEEPIMKGTPVHEILKKVAAYIVPLNLVDPKSPDFRIQNCKTLHDMMRFLHERSYVEMFALADRASGKGGACRLSANLGLDLFIIDVGGGLVKSASGRSEVRIEDVTSRPLRALLSGLALPKSGGAMVKTINLGGFLSVLSEQMTANPKAGGERFGDRSYAVISDSYLNFSSRVGYHYGVLDSFCGGSVNTNYITFSFKGGAADDVRRNRRARAIALILERSGFTVDVTGDRVDARFQKYEAEEIEEHLVMAGRLLQVTRQMDMLMESEAAVTAFAESFLSGAYERRPKESRK